MFKEAIEYLLLKGQNTLTHHLIVDKGDEIHFLIPGKDGPELKFLDKGIKPLSLKTSTVDSYINGIKSLQKVCSNKEDGISPVNCLVDINTMILSEFKADATIDFPSHVERKIYYMPAMTFDFRYLLVLTGGCAYSPNSFISYLRKIKGLDESLLASMSALTMKKSKTTDIDTSHIGLQSGKNEMTITLDTRLQTTPITLKTDWLWSGIIYKDINQVTNLNLRLQAQLDEKDQPLFQFIVVNEDETTEQLAKSFIENITSKLEDGYLITVN